MANPYRDPQRIGAFCAQPVDGRGFSGTNIVTSSQDSVHAFILTLNEERHIVRCLESLAGHCASVTVVDSGSTDETVALAERHGAQILRNAWTNHATQVNFAIAALSDRGGWLFRIDADEVLDPDSAQSLSDCVHAVPAEVDGLLVRRRIVFMGRRIRHGGVEPSWQLRLWRNGRGRCEQRWMDEHVVVDGPVVRSGLVISDINLNSVDWWTAKHNGYASREAIDLLNRKYGFSTADDLRSGHASPQARRRRFLKERVYARIPKGARALLYFLYRYVLRLGFLDGAPGWYFTVMQGFWYRTLVDAKVMDIETFARESGASIPEAIAARTGIAVAGDAKDRTARRP